VCRLLCAAVTSLVATASSGAFDLSLATVSSPAMTLENVQVHASRLDGGPARVRVQRALIGGRELRDVRLECADFVAFPEQRCRGGVVSAAGFGPWLVEFSVRGTSRVLQASLQLEPAVRIDVTGTLAGAHPQLLLTASRLDIGRLFARDEVLNSWQPAGRVDVSLALADFGAAQAPSARFRAVLSDAGFSSADGLRAAAALAATVDITATRDGDRWRGRVAADWAGGELLWGGVYLKGGATALSSAFTLSDQTVDFSAMSLDLAGVGRIDGHASFDRDAQALSSGRFGAEKLDLAALNERLIAPLFLVRGWPALRMRGQGGLEVAMDAAGIRSARLDLLDAELADTAGRLVLTGLSARIPWRRGEPTEATASVSQAAFGRLDAGPFDIAVDLAPERVSVKPVRIPVLDAGLRINALTFRQVAGRWDADLSADLEPVAMPAVTEALGWPKMAGSLAASVPHIRLRDGVMTLDGQMLIRVFGGYFAASALQVIEPFSATPRVLADVQMRYIDLEALTDTFSFGRITGRLDGEITGLEMAHWRPVGFDARIHSSEGDYPREISQRAVESITALGGPGAAAAIQRSFLGFFERFGYRRMGVSCRLLGGVCVMDGLAEKNGGFVLIEGGGVPALSVVGYNRRVDWQELLDRLARVTDSKPVIE
jgi:hypothetical protein